MNLRISHKVTIPTKTVRRFEGHLPFSIPFARSHLHLLPVLLSDPFHILFSSLFIFLYHRSDTINIFFLLSSNSYRDKQFANAYSLCSAYLSLVLPLPPLPEASKCGLICDLRTASSLSNCAFYPI